MEFSSLITEGALPPGSFTDDILHVCVGRRMHFSGLSIALGSLVLMQLSMIFVAGSLWDHYGSQEGWLARLHWGTQVASNCSPVVPQVIIKNRAWRYWTVRGQATLLATYLISKMQLAVSFHSRCEMGLIISPLWADKLVSSLVPRLPTFGSLGTRL